ncbi:CE1759 family FMN reductase [Brachybacterium sp. GCM10030267]|uniref:CE1759 family FMN reductase n=1 Tax=Brachybacterium sp. GCM10030267 TaxID=3273381 RepID=UPI00360C95A9
MTGPIRLVALSAGLSTPSSTRMLADQLSREAASALGRDGAEVDVRTVELREYAHDITDAMLTRFPGERLSMVIESVRAADAVIAVTPVFNVGPSGLFKSFFDAIDIDIWKAKPVLLGATAGTSRHSLAIDYAIRPMFGYLKAEVVPTVVFAASADFGADADAHGDEQPLAARVRRASAELATMLRSGIEEAAGEAASDPAGATGATSATSGAADETQGPALDAEFSDFVPMDKLLGGR